MTQFISLNEAAVYASEFSGRRVEFIHIQGLAKAGLLPVYARDGEPFLLVGDVYSLKAVFDQLDLWGHEPLGGADLFAQDVPNTAWFRSDSFLELVRATSDVDPAFFAASRNLISMGPSLGHSASGNAQSASYFVPARLATANRRVRDYADDQMRRVREGLRSEASQFARSAYYMGSKRQLRGFLLEALAEFLPQEEVVVDLMCGSGAAAGAFSSRWETFVSDALAFCRILGIIQGGGASMKEAATWLDEILPVARQHADRLASCVDHFLEAEDRLLHSDQGALQDNYKALCEEFPVHRDAVKRGEPPICSHGWDPTREVLARRRAPRSEPYCLFTSYFATVYLGIRQCVEIDSLRFAIDRVSEPRARQWALGALLAATSALGTTYAGHFAQPPRETYADVGHERLSAMLERRAHSVTHEFVVRLLNLAEESEKAPRVIQELPGPWSAALQACRSRVRGRAAVYLDAPYKREEYSRYYHVLETLVRYDYPQADWKGRTPDRRMDDRPRSEFSTRSRARLNEAFVKLVSEVLSQGWICAWSYSDTGDADIPAVVDGIRLGPKGRVVSFATPFEHKSQGGRSPKQVTEYVVVFDPGH